MNLDDRAFRRELALTVIAEHHRRERQKVAHRRRLAHIGRRW